MIVQRRVQRALVLCVLAFCTAAFLFGRWPETDLWASGLFARDDGCFPARENAWIAFMRYRLWNVTTLLWVVAFVMMIFAPRIRPAARIATRIWSFVFLSFLIGPGLLVNGLLKTYSGRARPYEIEEFGGEATFTPALWIAEECARNCSFVSGEAAGLFTAAMVLSLTLLPTIENPHARRATLAATWCVAVFGAGLRIAMGAHFLSDVVFALILCASVTLGMFLALKVDRSQLRSVTPTNALRDVTTLFRATTTWIADRFA